MVLIKVTEEMKEAARTYAALSKPYTSRRHDFHKGGPDEASKKMYAGKIGEKAFAYWLDNMEISYLEDKTMHYEADIYDFMILDLKIDVKTRTEYYHTRTLEMVEQFKKRPKDIYVSVYYNERKETVKILGCIGSSRLKRLHPIENNGHGNNYVAFDDDLSSIYELAEYVKKRMG